MAMERSARYDPLSSTSNVCCISPHRHDGLRLISFPRNLFAAFRIAIQSSWINGIQSEGVNYLTRCYDFKFYGYPWSSSMGDSSAVERCRLTIEIMRFMLSHGWVLELSTHSQIYSDHDDWFFRRGDLETDVLMCGISFNKSDKIRIVEGPPEVIDVVRFSIRNHWYWGLQDEGTNSGLAQVFKLKGNPWTNSSERTEVNMFLMQLMHELRNFGWNVYASVGLKAMEGKHTHKLDDWILKQAN